MTALPAMSRRRFNRPSRSAARRGFSLVEVLVASVMVSIASVGVAHGITSIQRTNNRANESLERRQIARSLSESYRAIPFASLTNGTVVVFVDGDGVQSDFASARYMATVSISDGNVNNRKNVSVQIVGNPYRRPASTSGANR